MRSKIWKSDLIVDALSRSLGLRIHIEGRCVLNESLFLFSMVTFINEKNTFFMINAMQEEHRISFSHY